MIEPVRRREHIVFSSARDHAGNPLTRMPMSFRSERVVPAGRRTHVATTRFPLRQATGRHQSRRSSAELIMLPRRNTVNERVAGVAGGRFTTRVTVMQA